ncbi:MULTISPECIES: DUF2336 domain-containing protein [Brucella/Ochrobactrum group]|jgi:uncharacterized protein (DUF2336 family)|uniref:DUF2336 domain-containing protein n=1 Tax=Brucella pseudintermedia TaxID=370111 RepID=A0ABY5UC09_9HYPH|nr:MULTISPECIES: DUF2336 domain-containing protein [Brucella/Ochrobactrum group]KAB2683911.1 DUF2336 domain-containing protein [Brucella pseudintermedia]MCO7727727.1 DUF2336 domain-containing protein [Brucella intermedia]NKE77093.1 DUF2336 domain-containing protein [Ochrobactrum sp. MC-1LL]UWL60859.1 DUF2336 domain-containing protein [Brucella pseudintermedia]
MYIEKDALAGCCEPVAARVVRAAHLARQCVDQNLPDHLRAQAEATLTLLLDDPSPKVRVAMADVLSTSVHSPLHIVTALAADQPDVAGYILARSTLLSDADLVDRVAYGAPTMQVLIAARPHVSFAVSAAIAEVGSNEAVAEMLANSCARITSVSFRRICERCGHDALVREALLSHPHLPAECRHLLAVKVGEVLQSLPLVKMLLGARRADKVVGDATVRASMHLAETCSQEELPALVEHLRLRGEITTSFVIRAVAGGRIDFFASLLVALSDLDDARICAIISRGRPAALAALLRSAGLSDATHAPLIVAIEAWRAVAAGRKRMGAAEISALMCEATRANRYAAANDDLAALLRSIHLEFMRESARDRLEAISA